MVHLSASCGPLGGGGKGRQLPAQTSQTSGELPLFDLAPFLEAPESRQARELCAALAACLHETSALVVRDPRVDSRLNDSFLDLMERYFAQPLETKMADVREDLSYQVGG